jgi:hypothetical protein
MHALEALPTDIDEEKAVARQRAGRRLRLCPDIGELVPRPNRLARLPRLEFHADGDASGAFEVTLVLVDDEGHESQPLRLDEICGPAE